MMTIALATEQNIDNWMELVHKVKGSFPGLETQKALAEHRDTVVAFIRKASAICATTDNKIVGTLLFSKEANEVCFLAVDAQYRRQHIAEKMFSYMLTHMDAKHDIVVKTYRADVLKGIPARKFYKKMGFLEGKLTEQFGMPVQELILKR